jgi:cytosine deaminase
VNFSPGQSVPSAAVFSSTAPSGKKRSPCVLGDVAVVPGRPAIRVATGARMTDSRVMTSDTAMLSVALDEARAGRAEGGIPIGAALFSADGTLLGRGRNRRVQDDDPSAHGETAAFRAAGRRPSYRDTTMTTTLSPCWYCSGLILQFGISRVVVGEARTFAGRHEWLAGHGVEVVLLDNAECADLMTAFIREHPRLWNEDIGTVSE